MGEYKAGFTINEASEYTGIGRNTMRNLVAWGKLPVLKVGRKVIIRRELLEAFMEANQGRNLKNVAEVKAGRFNVTKIGLQRARTQQFVHVVVRRQGEEGSRNNPCTKGEQRVQ